MKNICCGLNSDRIMLVFEGQVIYMYFCVYMWFVIVVYNKFSSTTWSNLGQTMVMHTQNLISLPLVLKECYTGCISCLTEEHFYTER